MPQHCPPLSSSSGGQTPGATHEDARPPHRLVYQDYSPPRDFELIDGAFAVVVVDKVLVTHPNALVVHCEALG